MSASEWWWRLVGVQHICDEACPVTSSECKLGSETGSMLETDAVHAIRRHHALSLHRSQIGSALLQALLQTEGVTYHVLRVHTYAHAL